MDEVIMGGPQFHTREKLGGVFGAVIARAKSAGTYKGES